MTGGRKSRSRVSRTTTPSKPISKAASNGGLGVGIAEGCEHFSEVTILSSPNPAVLVELQPDMELTLVLRTNPEIIAALHGSQIAGSVVPSNLAMLIKCIRGGSSFVATVIRVNGGLCEVLIRYAGKL